MAVLRGPGAVLRGPWPILRGPWPVLKGPAPVQGAPGLDSRVHGQMPVPGQNPGFPENVAGASGGLRGLPLSPRKEIPPFLSVHAFLQSAVLLREPFVSNWFCARTQIHNGPLRAPKGSTCALQGPRASRGVRGPPTGPNLYRLMRVHLGSRGPWYVAPPPDGQIVVFFATFFLI